MGRGKERERKGEGVERVGKGREEMGRKRREETEERGMGACTHCDFRKSAPMVYAYYRSSKPFLICAWLRQPSDKHECTARLGKLLGYGTCLRKQP